MKGKDDFLIFTRRMPVDRAKDVIEEIGELEVDKDATRDTLLENIDKYDAILAGSNIEYDEELLKKAEGRLKIIARTGVGYDNVNVQAATRHGIMATYTPGLMAEAVAEQSLLLMMAAARNLIIGDRETRNGNWDWESYRGQELWDKTLGQVGLGRIGYLVAEKVRKSFNMRVLVNDPYVNESKILSIDGNYAYFDELLEESDVISINVPLNERTRHLIGEEELNKMKDSAILVNTSRGPVIDEKALVEALREGEIAKAGLDVFEQEPPRKDNPLLEMDNVVLAPHQGGNTFNAWERIQVAASNCIKSALKGERPKFLLNEEVLEK